MDNKVYIFNMNNPFTFFKAGQYFAEADWRHKDVNNDGDYEIFIILTGVVYIQIGSVKYELHKHDCLLIPPYVRHFGYKDSPNNTNYYWIHFYPSGLVTTTYYPNLNTKKAEIIIPQLFNILDFERITILVRQLLDAANEDNTLSFTANYFISSIMIEICNQFLPQINGIESRKHSSRFELIKNWIRIHSHENLTVDIVAKNFEITPTYLTSLFNKYEKTTTIRFINKIKVDQAKELLLTTNMSVKQIALELSFKNEKYFFRIFKKETQITPTQFRNSFDKTYLNNIEVDPPIDKPAQLQTEDFKK